MGDGLSGSGPEAEISQDSSESLTEQLEGMDPLDAERVEALLLRPDFGQMVAKAIWQTDHPTQDALASKKRQQEYGFVGVRFPGHVDQSFHLSPLFEGDERAINLITQSTQWIKNTDVPPIISFRLHTHPHPNPTRLREGGFLQRCWVRN